MIDPSLNRVATLDVRAGRHVPLYGNNHDAQRAYEAGLAHAALISAERNVNVGLSPIVRALVNDAGYWPAEVWGPLQDAVDEHVQEWVATHRVDLTVAGMSEVVDAAVWAVRRVLAPARDVPRVYAPVAVLLGPRLRELRYRPTIKGELQAVWAGGQTSTTRNGDCVELARALTPRWSAPVDVRNEDNRTWDPAALRIGETVAWHELSDRSLLEVTAFLSYLLTQGGLIAPVYAPIGRRDLSFALAEAAYRDTIPTPEDLRVACDLAEARGVLTAEAIERWTLVELWARCMPILWGDPSPRQ